MARRTRLVWFALAAAFLAADLWTKHAVFYPWALRPGFRTPFHAGELASWWRTTLVYNEGVTFGSFVDIPVWVKSAVTGAVILWIGSKLWKARPGQIGEPLAFSMIAGGAVGNLYDRTLRLWVEPDQRPGVRDFLDWFAPEGTGLAQFLEGQGITTHWYTSNVADVLIVCGVILLAIQILRTPDAPSAVPAAAPSENGPAAGTSA